MKKRFFIFLILLALSLLLTGVVFGSEKELAVSIQVVSTENSSVGFETAQDNQGGLELGSLKGIPEEESKSSGNQNIINRIFANEVMEGLLTFNLERINLVFLLPLLVFVLLILYLIWLLFRKKKKHKESRIKARKIKKSLSHSF